MSGIVSFNEALGIVQHYALDAGLRVGASQSQTEEVPLLSARGRTLAGAVSADRDQPPFARATRDGFAVHSPSLTRNNSFRVLGEVRAGEHWSGQPLQPAEAIAIMTGAPLPAGADSVLMIEHTHEADGFIRVEPSRSLNAGENVVPRGAEARRGQTVLTAGTPVDAAEIALAASCGQATLPVYARPVVSIVATGDELVDVDQIPEDWQIRNSNSYALAALVEAAGGQASRSEPARDLRDEIKERIEHGRRKDLLLFSGGVSMGKYDLVEDVLSEFGAEFFFTGVRMQPGKPVVFGRLPSSEASGGGPECLFFGLPGNPVSTEVTFHCFVGPLLRVLSGAAWRGPRFVLARLAEDVGGKPDLTRVLPARFVSTEVSVVRWQGSGDLTANARANAYVLLPPEVAHFSKGDVVTVLLR